MRISMLVPTRERPAGLQRFLKSVYDMTLDKSRIEILVACDEDDELSKTYTTRLIEEYKNKLDIRMYTRERSEFLNRDYYNWLGWKSEAELFFILADDLEFLQLNWDELVVDNYNRLSQHYPDKIFSLSLKDSTKPPRGDLPKFACFPIFTREARNALGFLLHPNPPNWGVDLISYEIFYPIGRLFQFHTCNYINHISHHTHQCLPDSTSHRIGSIFDKLKHVAGHDTDVIREKEVGIIRNKLKQSIADFYGKHARELKWPDLTLNYPIRK